MNELERFERLASQARGDPVPPIDVAARVVRDLRSGVSRGEPSGPLWVLSGLSVVAALIVSAVAIESWSALTDPLAGLFYPLTMVMQ